MTTPFPSDLNPTVARDLRRAIDRIPTIDAATPEPACWVQTLALEAMLLGTYSGLYTWSSSEWTAFLRLIHSYGQAQGSEESFPEAPRPGEVFDRGAVFESPDHPLLDAALRIARAEGVHAITFENIAKVSGRGMSFLLSMYGDVDELMHDLLQEVFDDGFEGLTYPGAEVSAAAIRQNLQYMQGTRQMASYFRLLTLTGVRVDPEVVSCLRLDGLDRAKELPHVSQSPMVWLAPIVLDGWQMLEAAPGYPGIEGVPFSALRELRELAETTWPQS